MMVKKIAVLLLTASFFLGACGQPEQTQHSGSTANNETGQNQGITVQREEEKQMQTQEPEQDRLSKDTTSKNDIQDDKHQTKTEDQSAKKPEYHMNKVYDIVPNDEKTEEKVVLLTFDDGPKDKEMINDLIDTLDKHHAKAIFFVNGYRVKQNPELLQLIHDRGQIIGNHSWDHIDLSNQSYQEAKKQIEDVQQIVMKTIGEKPKFFRPPFGSGDDDVKQIAKDNNMLFMTWSNGSLDWDAKSKNNPDAIIKNVMDQLHPGSNILMHELPWTVEALDTLLTKLKNKGYSFVDPRNIELKMR